MIAIGDLAKQAGEAFMADGLTRSTEPLSGTLIVPCNVCMPRKGGEGPVVVIAL